jgi:Stage II sporulation protein E (SpoIIE)
MRTVKRELWFWALAGGLGAAAFLWAHPRVFPYQSANWQLSRSEATTIALERLRQLGEPVPRAYVVAHWENEPLIERRLHGAERETPLATLVASPLAEQVTGWEVVVYPAGAAVSEWAYRAELTLAGKVLALRRRVPATEAGEPLDATTARTRADSFLADQGYRLAEFREPELRTQQQAARTDTAVRYRYLQQVLGEEVPYGVQVTFAGDRLTGFLPYFDDPLASRVASEIQPVALLGVVRILTTFVLLLAIAVPFLRRYHAGEIGVRRGLQLLGVVLTLGTLLMMASARASTEGVSFGVLSRAVTSWVYAAQLLMVYFLPLALVVFLTWSVGESLCRERWGGKLAAFDAVFQGRWTSATVARAAWIGTGAGLALVGVAFASAVAAAPLGIRTLLTLNGGPWWADTAWMGLGLLAFSAIYALQGELFARLLLVPSLDRRWGRWPGGIVAAVVGGLVCWNGPLVPLPIGWSMLISMLTAGLAVALFLRYDLLTTLVCNFVSGIVVSALPLAMAADPSVQFQGCLAMLGGFLPLLVTVRHLVSDEEFEYRYDDVPPHVRRIAERERQRVELETARNIQSSILPDLPPRLNGIDIAHAYEPASEVGGDFYDCLALEDGRLAVAVGDVAGHGVSSGLVMAMTRSALAVQVTFDPEVGAVFATLNRVVHQSARKRLLTTLCYALLDPRRRELVYGSAGHLFPYRVSDKGQVDSLESVAYPLGVRAELMIQQRTVRLEAADTLVLFSDGVPEARQEDGDEQFGFDRLEASLRRHAGQGPERVRDGVLADLRDFTGDGPREDDLTLLVLRLPAA